MVTVWSLICKLIFLLSKETVVLCEWESEMKIWFYQMS